LRESDLISEKRPPQHCSRSSKEVEALEMPSRLKLLQAKPPWRRSRQSRNLQHQKRIRFGDAYEAEESPYSAKQGLLVAADAATARIPKGGQPDMAASPDDASDALTRLAGGDEDSEGSVESVSGAQDLERRKPGQLLRKLSANLMSNIRKARGLSEGNLASSEREFTDGAQIASRDVDGLKDDNSPRDTSRLLQEGEKVVQYQVTAGETIDGVAMKHGMPKGQFRQLNRMFGTYTLYPGQVVLVVDRSSDPEEESDEKQEEADEPKPERVVRRRSSLGGTVFENVSLFDGNKIEISGSLEVNSFFVSFIPSRFISTEAPEDILELKESHRLLKKYAFRLDVRDVVGCGILESPMQPMKRQNAIHLQIRWVFPRSGYDSPTPVYICVDSVEACNDLIKLVQDEIIKQKAKSDRYEMMRVKPADSVTTGAVINGLLYKPDSGPPASGPIMPGSPLRSPLQSPGSAAASGSKFSLTSGDLVQQSLLKGDISLDEAKELRLKNEEVIERMVALEQAQEKIDQETSKLQRKGPFALLSKKKQDGSASSAVNEESSSALKSENTEDEPHKSPRLHEWLRKRLSPTFEGMSSDVIKDPEELIEVSKSLPERLRGMRWKVAYDFEHDGVSLDELYNKAAGHKETLLFVETTDGDRFGCFASETWNPSTKARSFYGTGESFVFNFKPSFQLFRWVGANDLVMTSSRSHIGMGAGEGFIFCIDEHLNLGTSSPSSTFGNTEALPYKPEFRVAQLELICFLPAQKRKVRSLSDADANPVSLFRD